MQNQGTRLGQERDQARLLGRVRYFTGRPCIHGHVAERYVKSGNCVECLRITVEKNRSLQARIEHALMVGKLTKSQAEMWNSVWYCEGWGLPCGHIGWQRVIDDRCKMCLEQEEQLLG